MLLFEFLERNLHAHLHVRPGRARAIQVRNNLRQLVGQILGFDLVAARQNHGVLHDVAKFAHISRPGVLPHRRFRRRGKPVNPLATLTGEETKIAIGDVLQISQALAQRRQPERDHVQAVKQILAKSPVAHRLFQIAIRRGNDAHVRAPGLRLAKPLVFLFLQQAEQFGLNLQRQFSDLIQEQRAAVGHRHFAPGIGHGAGVCAFHPAEQLTLQQFPRETRTTDRDKRLVPVRAALMNCPGQHRFARAALAQNHDRSGRGRGLERHGQHFLHRRFARAQIRIGRIRRKAVLQLHHAVFEFSRLANLAQHLPHLFGRERFGKKVRRSTPHGFHRRLNRGVSRADNHVHVRMALEQFRQQLKAAFTVELQIQERDIERPFIQLFERGGPVLYADRFVPHAFQQDSRRLADAFFVIYD